MSDDEKSDVTDTSDINDFWGTLPEGVFDDGDNEVEDNDEGVDIRIPGAEHLLVLLDCSPDMFVPCMSKTKRDESGQLVSPIDAVINSLKIYVRQSVRTTVMSKNGKRNGFGVHLFATRERERLDLDQELAKKREERHNKNKKKRFDKDDSDKEDDPHDEVSDDQDSDDESDYQNSQSQYNISDMHTLVPLDPPGIDTIKKLRHCLEPHKIRNIGRTFDIKQEFGHKQGDEDSARTNYPNAIMKVCRELPTIFRETKCVHKPGFKHSNPIVGDDTKTVWIFTSNDDPAPEDDEKHSLASLVNDLKASGVKINVFPLPTKERKGGFSKDCFYHQIADVAEPQEEGEDLDLDDLMADRWKAVRRTFEVPLFFPDQLPKGICAKDLESQTQSRSQTQTSQDDSQANGNDKPMLPPTIMLEFYTPLNVQREPSKVKILRKVGVNDEFAELLTMRYLQGEETTEQLGRFVGGANQEEKKLEQQQPGLAKIGSFVQLKSGEYIPVTKEEVAAIKRDASLCGDLSSLVLHGFKPRSEVPLHFINKKTYFAYPVDKVVEGSREAFAYLHKSMVDKNVVGIGELLPRRTGTSRLVALNPTEESLDDEGGQKCPPGWVVTYLPFENEVNQMPPDLSLEDGLEVTEEVTEAIESIINKMYLDKFDAGSESYDNPYLKKFWDWVEATALGEDLSVNENEYMLVPRSDDELAKLRKLMENLDGALPEDEKPVKKRPIPELTEGTDWKTQLGLELRNGNLDKYKNADLSAALKLYGKKCSGKKSELVERLTAAIQEEEF